MMREQGCGGFAVAAGNADLERPGEPAAEFDLRDHRYSLCFHFPYQRNVIGYSRALDHQVGIQEPVDTMSMLFKHVSESRSRTAAKIQTSLVGR